MLGILLSTRDSGLMTFYFSSCDTGKKERGTTEHSLGGFMITSLYRVIML